MQPIDEGTRRRLIGRFGSAAEAWLEDLPARLATVAERWQLEVGDQIPRGSVCVVHRCRVPDGRGAVLKVSPDRIRMAFEADALRRWRTGHTPEVLALDHTLGALLLESIEPGTPLDVSGAQPGVERIGELLVALHGSAEPRPSYPPLEQRVRYLFDASTKLYEWHPWLREPVPPALYERGRARALALARSGPAAVLVHGDLTPRNVLDGGPARGLVAIDPAPSVGDGAFDAVDLLVWGAGDVPTIEARVARLAAVTGLDGGRVLGWCEAFAAMNAMDLLVDGAPGSEALLELAGRV